MTFSLVTDSPANVAGRPIFHVNIFAERTGFNFANAWLANPRDHGQPQGSSEFVMCVSDRVFETTPTIVATPQQWYTTSYLTQPNTFTNVPARANNILMCHGFAQNAVTGATSAMVATSTDGVNWNINLVGFVPVAVFGNVATSGAITWFAPSIDGLCYSSTTNGVSWSPVSAVVAGATYTNCAFAGCDRKSAVIVRRLVDTRSMAYDHFHSTDNGITWTYWGRNNSTALNSQTYWLGDQNKNWMLINGGPTLYVNNADGLDNSFNDGKATWLATSGAGTATTNRMFLDVDNKTGTATWKALAKIGNFYEVHSTSDGGKTWTKDTITIPQNLAGAKQILWYTADTWVVTTATGNYKQTAPGGAWTFYPITDNVDGNGLWGGVAKPAAWQGAQPHYSF